MKSETKSRKDDLVKQIGVLAKDAKKLARVAVQQYSAEVEAILKAQVVIQGVSKDALTACLASVSMMKCWYCIKSSAAITMKLTRKQQFHTSTPIRKCGMNNNPAKSRWMEKAPIADRGSEGRQGVRQETIRIVREMQEKDLDREGMYASHGKGKLDRFIRWAYEHVRLHEDDIRKVQIEKSTLCT